MLMIPNILSIPVTFLSCNLCYYIRVYSPQNLRMKFDHNHFRLFLECTFPYFAFETVFLSCC